MMQKLYGDVIGKSGWPPTPKKKRNTPSRAKKRALPARKG